MGKVDRRKREFCGNDNIAVNKKAARVSKKAETVPVTPHPIQLRMVENTLAVLNKEGGFYFAPPPGTCKTTLIRLMTEACSFESPALNTVAIPSAIH